MIRHIKALAFAGALLSVAAFSVLPASAQVPESEDPIKIAINDWTSQYVGSYIIGGIFERMGYEVEYIQADALAMFPAFEEGDLHIMVEIWPNMEYELFQAGLATGNVLNMGEAGLNAIEDWWYPTYMEEVCPGLPNWEALKNPDCTAALAVPETDPKGRFLGGPVQWAGFDEERIEALGLNLQVIHAGTEGALWAEMASAYARGAPILQWAWVPHWWPTKYDGKFIDWGEQAYEPECYDDPSWGINPDMKYDCGKPVGTLKKMAWTGGEEIWPVAYSTFRNYQLNDALIAELLIKADVEGQEPQQVAEDWLDANEHIWGPWTK
jgi:glycine betaine/proline transport system substrate-binding protein